MAEEDRVDVAEVVREVVGDVVTELDAEVVTDDVAELLAVEVGVVEGDVTSQPKAPASASENSVIISFRKCTNSSHSAAGNENTWVDAFASNALSYSHTALSP